MVLGAFDGLPVFTKNDPASEIAAAEVSANIRKIPGYGGHIRGIANTCGATYGTLTSQLSDEKKRHLPPHGATLLMNNLTEKAQAEGFFEDALGTRRDLTARPVPKILVNYGGHAPEEKRNVGQTFGSYVFKQYHPRTEMMTKPEENLEETLAASSMLVQTLRASALPLSEVEREKQERAAAAKAKRATSSSSFSPAASLNSTSLASPTHLSNSSRGLIQPSNFGVDVTTASTSPRSKQKTYPPGTGLYVPGKHDVVGASTTEVSKKIFSGQTLEDEGPPRKTLDWDHMDPHWCGYRPRHI